MGANENLITIYNKLVPNLKSLYVIPLIRYNYPKSDYLCLFYKGIIESNNPPKIISTSVWSHFRFTFARLLTNRCLVHYHWFECQDKRAVLGMIYKWLCLFLYKLAGGKLVWTIHNKMPHNKKFYRLNFILRKWMARNADLLHVHCESIIKELSDFYNIPEKKFVVLPHPEFPAKLIPRAAAAEALNIRFNLKLKSSNKIFLSFGNISAYKGLDELASCFCNLDKNKKLIIAGPVKKGNMDHYKKLKEIESQTENVHLIPKFISENCVAEFFNAADYAVFNYKDILTSGSVELATSYRKKLIIPPKGCLKELADHPNVITFDSIRELEHILQTI